MKRGGPLKRKTELKADPEKTKEWKRRSKPLKTGDKPMARTAMTKKPTQRKTDYERALDALTPALVARSGGLCEIRWPLVCTGRAVHRHHRKLGRGEGTQDSVEALLHLCNECHNHIHTKMPRKMAEANGYIVKRSVDPVSVPVTRLRRLT
jgi:hypothetical protein